MQFGFLWVQGQEPQDEDYLTHQSASLSTHDTLVTTSASGTTENTSRQWTDQEINLLNYVEESYTLMTGRGLILKKSEFNKASNYLKSKDAGQCQYISDKVVNPPKVPTGF